MRRWSCAIPALSLIASGCMTAQSYDGERRETDEVARITGDPVITAGAPVTVVLRRVDGRSLSVGERSVDVLPGKHELLVDCRIAETRAVSRHSIDVEVSAGERYRLVAQTSPGLRECTDVSLEVDG